MTTTASKRVLVIGLDCATPQFVFGGCPGIEPFELPNLRRLMAAGCWGPLRSCDPPITVPAWACMTSGKDPGVLGCYGFRNRKDYSYAGMKTANASAIRERRLWDLLSRAGKKVVVLGVPQTYPPPAVNGWLVADFLAPDTNADYTYPKALKNELEETLGEYLLDVKDFRTDDKERLLKQLYVLMNNRFDAARHLMTTKPWDFFMMVEMGVDRLHHGFWVYCDPTHPRYEPGNPFEHAFRDYYEALDRRIGELLALVGDETAVLVVSDHGARGMTGGVCVNQWLMREGLLTLDETLTGRKRIEDCAIDWTKSYAWGSGGYYGRVFLNVEGREPNGIIPAAQYEAFRADLIRRIEAMVGPDGQPLGNRAYRPEDLYKEARGLPPDLFVYFGNLAWRSVGAVGYDDVFTFENDTGPDDANHDFHGIFVMDDRSGQRVGRRESLQLMDVAPTVLNLFGLDVPDDIQGHVVT